MPGLRGSVRRFGALFATSAVIGAAVVAGASPAAAATLTVMPAPVSGALVPDAVAGTPYSQTFTATGGTGTVTITKTLGTLPDGLSMTGATLSGTPTAVGTFNFTISASTPTPDAGVQNYNLTVDPPIIHLAPTTLPSAVINVVYPNQSLAATGGTAPYSYTLGSGALPTGLALSGTGVVSGMPTVAGSYTFTVKATDSTTVAGTYFGQQSYTIAVGAAQTITFPALTNQAFTSTPQALTATTDAAGLQVTYTSATTGTCTVTSAGVMTFVGSGLCTIHADQAGNATYAPAAQVSRSFTIGATAPTVPTGVTAVAGNQQAFVSFTAPTSTGGSTLSYVATASPEGQTSAGCTASPCTVNGLVNGHTYTFTVVATNAASVPSLPSAASNPVTPAPAQTITFTAIPTTATTPAVGTSVTLAATATSGLPVTYSSTPASICTVSGNTLTLVAVGSCVVKADQAGNSSFSPAPTQTQTITVQKGTPTVTVTSSANPSVAGQPLTFTAILTAPPATSGTIQWNVDSANVGAPVTLTTATATYSPTTPLTVGSHAVKAIYTPLATDTNDNGATSASLAQVVNKASTTTTVAVTGNTLTATVHPVAPATGTPTGTVAFTVGGVPAGTGTLAAGVATVTGTNVGTQPVVATYSGDASYLTSTGNRNAVVNPTVTASVISGHAKTSYGWYRSTVKVIFTCTQGSAPLTAACPGTVKLSTNTAGRKVTRTVTATDGGTKTVTTSTIRIDGTAPKLTVKQTGHTLTCKGSDSLSGLASCKITKHSKTKNGVKTVTWSATATDKAGNKTKKHGHFSYAV